MPLTNEEFARMDAARVNSLQHRQAGSNKRILQLAFEHLEDLSRQQARAIRLIEIMDDTIKRSLCFRVRRFFVRWWIRAKETFR